MRSYGPDIEKHFSKVALWCGGLHIRLTTKASPGRDTNPCGVTSGRASGVKVCQIKHAELPAERRESESSQKLKVVHGVECRWFVPDVFPQRPRFITVDLHVDSVTRGMN